VQHALVLATLNADMTDAVGNQYPSHGFVSARNFKPDQDIFAGLHGVLWGRTGGCSHLKDEEDSKWTVIKVDETRNIILIDELNNIVKFEDGLVVHVGDRKTAADYIVNYRQENQMEGDEGHIAGSIVKAILPNFDALNHAFRGRSISGIAGLHAISTALRGFSLATQPASNAICLGTNGTATTFDDDAHAMAFGGHSTARTCGKRSNSIVLGHGSRAICTGESCIALCLAAGCEAIVGDRGSIVMISEDRILVGRVGYGIESRCVYTSTENSLVLVE